jgi:outer membrane protein
VHWGLAAVPALIIAALAAAQQQPARIGFVNSEELLPRMPEFRSADSTYQSVVAAGRVEVQAIRAAFDSVNRLLNVRTDSLPQAERDRLLEDLQTVGTRLTQRSQELSQQAEARRQQLMAPLLQRTRTVIDGLRAERNLAVVFDVAANGSGIVAVDPSLDLTIEVVRRLQAGQ